MINSSGIGGMQLSNTVFSGSTGKVGVDARDVPIAVRLTIGDIDASGSAIPYLLFGEGSFTTPANNSGLRITGGDLLQSNGARIVAISEAKDLISQNNFKSDVTRVSRKVIRGIFDFIDEQVQIYQGYAPESLNGKTYELEYEIGGYSETYIFSGNTSGTFKRVEDVEFNGIDYLFKYTGRFNYRVDSEDPHTAHLTLTITTISVEAYGVNLLIDGVETVASEFDTVLEKSVDIELNFLNSVSGKLSATFTYTDDLLYTDSGKFRELTINY